MFGNARRQLLGRAYRKGGSLGGGNFNPGGGNDTAAWMSGTLNPAGVLADPNGASNGPGGYKQAIANPDLSAFNALFPQIQQGILANQGQMGNIANTLGGLASGQSWGNFTQQQMGQFDVLANQRQQATLSQLARQGLTGTAASSALDQQAQQVNAQRQQLSGQLGQQGLQFQGNMLGMQENALGQANQMGNEALTNTLAAPAINIGATAATNAGAIPSGKQGGKQ